MRISKYLMNGLMGVTAATFVGARFIPGAEQNGPVLTAAAAVVAKPAVVATTSSGESGSAVVIAVNKLSTLVRPLSHPKALETAFRSYFAFKSAHPDQVKKPYLYFVDYGLPSTEKRGYVFDMSNLSIVDGPFTVAHGRGSSTSQYGVPTRFSNSSGSSTSSLGLFLAQETYAFSGHTAGRVYNSLGLRLQGESGTFNSNARARGVVAHGAPYVTPTKAGRSQGCPAMELSRAQRLLPKLANGGMVFLFAPDSRWLAGDPWVVAANN